MEFLQRALREALDRNAAETVRWTQYKEQLEGAKANLEEFKKSLEIEIMVPVGSKALIPGRLYHTNEIVVSHSGTYYSKCSAHKALEICQHRLNIAASRLKALEAEAKMHRNKLELPLDFDAFSSKEIIETYDEEEEKRWRTDHKTKMKEFKRKEAEERQKLLNEQGEDDIIKKLDELELMEELESELEGLSEIDDDTMQAILNGSVEVTSDKKRISHIAVEGVSDNKVSLSVKKCEESVHESDSLKSDSDDDTEEDDDIPAEFKEIQKKAESMTNKEKLNFFKAKLAEVQDYLQNLRPRTMEEISHKTDKMFLSDHLLSAIETIADELICDQYLNGGNLINDESDSDTFSTVVTPSMPTQTKPILKKSNNKNVSNRKISFALEDDVKSFDGREEPSKISTTVIFEHGPVLRLNINHSEAIFKETNEKADVIRSPVDIYKKFADCTLNESGDEQRSSMIPSNRLNNSSVSFDVGKQPRFLDDGKKPFFPTTVRRPFTDMDSNLSNQTVPQEKETQAVNRDIVEAKTEVKEKQTIPQEKKDLNEDIVEAKTEVKEILDNIFGPKDTNEPDPLPEGNFVDAHQPKKRISLFKQRRQMKSQ